MAYEALYRRYRPSTFEDAFFGQDHVKAALINAVEGDRVGHAYLFSGPRGTGKTTSARILAKALNCTNLQGGEPCNECDSCLAFNAGGSYDLHELDAASNNGVDAMRDLIAKVALGSPGRTKVYILDEVHMLSSGAENALLKTLEEPPPHVVFVLCTTEPNKVVPTIRSRTQHLEFSLLSQSEVGDLVDHVVADAGLEITADDRAYVIRAGGGSARDTLSALDQVVAAGGAPRGGEHIDQLFRSLIARDSGSALDAIDGAMQAGRDPAGIGTTLLAELRSVFLATMRADLAHMPEAERERAEHYAAAMRPALATRAIEVLGSALIEMRQAPDPRVDLEVAIMRLTRADLDITPAALLERIEALEAATPRGPAPGGETPGGQTPGGPMSGNDDSRVSVDPVTPSGEAPAAPSAPSGGPDHTGGTQAQGQPGIQAGPQAAHSDSPTPAPGRAPIDGGPGHAGPVGRAFVDGGPGHAGPVGRAFVDGGPGHAGPVGGAFVEGGPGEAPTPSAGSSGGSAEAAPTAGRRGADMVRAALAKHQAASAAAPGVVDATSAAQPHGAQAGGQTSHDAAPAADPSAAEAPADPPLSLADRRRQRQAAAAQASIDSADTSGAPVADTSGAQPGTPDPQAATQLAPITPLHQHPETSHAPTNTTNTEAQEPRGDVAAPTPSTLAEAVPPEASAAQRQPQASAPEAEQAPMPPGGVSIEEGASPAVTSPVQSAPRGDELAPGAEQASMPPGDVSIEEGASPAATSPVQSAPRAGELAPAEAPPHANAPAVSLPVLGQLEAAWPAMLESMSGRVRSRFSAGRFLEHQGDSVVFGLPNPVHRDRCEDVRAEVDDSLAAHFGGRVPLTLVVDTAEVEPDIFATATAAPDDTGAPPVDHEDEAVDLDALTDATDQVAMSGVERVMATFEGSTLIEDPSTEPPDGR